MLDNNLYQTRSWTQNLALPDGTSVEVRKFEIRTLLTEREVLPIFQYDHLETGKSRRLIMPMFEYDAATKTVKGEEGVTLTLDERMIAIVDHVRSSGIDAYNGDQIGAVGTYVHFHMFFSGSERHMTGCLPHFEDMDLCFMVRANMVYSPVR